MLDRFGKEIDSKEFVPLFRLDLREKGAVTGETISFADPQKVGPEYREPKRSSILSDPRAMR
jgi:hypothetical protein